MSFIELFLIGVSLSMDAFAVAVCKGLGMKRIDYRYAFVIALFFGAFQGIMPTVGFFLGTAAASFVEPIDHWIAFALLVFVGGKMLWDTFHDGEEEGVTAADETARIDYKELFMLAVATSIDALAIGVSFAFLQVAIAPAACTIAATTFVISFAGVALGNKFGARWEKPSTIVGGVVLIVLGVKILLQHLGVLPF